MIPAVRASSAAERLTSSQGCTTAILMRPRGFTYCSTRTSSSPCCSDTRTCGSVPRGRSMRSVGAITVAWPEITVLPSWLMQLQSRTRRCFASSRSATATLIVSVSPTRTGAWNFSVWPA